MNSIARGAKYFLAGVGKKDKRQTKAGIAEFVRSNLPMRRFGTVEEVENVAVFLASDNESLLRRLHKCRSHSLI